jgi:hypothetical protein
LREDATAKVSASSFNPGNGRGTSTLVFVGSAFDGEADPLGLLTADRPSLSLAASDEES